MLGDTLDILAGTCDAIEASAARGRQELQHFAIRRMTRAFMCLGLERTCYQLLHVWRIIQTFSTP